MSREQVGFMNPKNLDEAIRCAELMAASNLVPKAYRDKPGDILVAGQMGAELGVAWLQALQNICVINGNPSVWGDLALALCKAHPAFEDIKEWYDESTRTAYCTIKRKDQETPTEQSFSWAEACQAGLNTKDTYEKYRRRMLQMRARSWCMRDSMPDALRGLKIAEEQIAIEGAYSVVDDDEAATDEAPRQSGMSGLAQSMNDTRAISGPKSSGEHPEGSPEWWGELLRQTTTLAQLEKVGFELRSADEQVADDMRGVYQKHHEKLVAGKQAEESTPNPEAK